jgi:hypothetical protein
MRILPKNWLEFQHYKDRSPIWIKLHRKILDDYEYHCLPVASKALAPLLWLLASEYQDGIIDGSAEKISFRLRMSIKELELALAPLVSSGFFDSYQDASEMIADRKPVACLEKRREETEKRIADFEIFWNTFNYKKGRGGAEKSWQAISNYSDDLFKKIIEGAKREDQERPALIAKNRTPKWAQGWITEKRWEDESTAPIMKTILNADGQLIQVPV